MGPAQFATHCVTNWKCFIKQSHIPQVGYIEAFPELMGETFRQCRQQSLPVRRPRLTALFELHDVPPYFPASPDLHHIHGAQRPMSPLPDQSTQGFQQSAQWRHISCCDAFHVCSLR
jgi:hypothetical protein